MYSVRKEQGGGHEMDFPSTHTRATPHNGSRVRVRRYKPSAHARRCAHKHRRTQGSRSSPCVFVYHQHARSSPSPARPPPPPHYSRIRKYIMACRLGVCTGVTPLRSLSEGQNGSCAEAQGLINMAEMWWHRMPAQLNRSLEFDILRPEQGIRRC